MFNQTIRWRDEDWLRPVRRRQIGSQGENGVRILAMLLIVVLSRGSERNFTDLVRRRAIRRRLIRAISPLERCRERKAGPVGSIGLHAPELNDATSAHPRHQAKGQCRRNLSGNRKLSRSYAQVTVPAAQEFGLGATHANCVRNCKVFPNVSFF